MLDTILITCLLLACYGFARLLMGAQEQIDGVNEPKTYTSNGRRYYK